MCVYTPSPRSPPSPLNPSPPLSLSCHIPYSTHIPNVISIAYAIFKLQAYKFTLPGGIYAGRLLSRHMHTRHTYVHLGNLTHTVRDTENLRGSVEFRIFLLRAFANSCAVSRGKRWNAVLDCTLLKVRTHM